MAYTYKVCILIALKRVSAHDIIKGALMAEIMDDVVHLSQEIGPHPAGTEEEQQAALYLAEEIQKESGFPAVIEDFQCVTNYLIPSLVCFGVALVAVIVSIVLPIAVIPCFIAVA